MLSGGRLNGASPAYNVEEMTYALKTARTRFVMTLPASLDAAVTACDNVGIPRRHIFLLEGQHKDFQSLQDLVQTGRWCNPEPPVQLPEGKNNQETCAFLNFSR